MSEVHRYTTRSRALGVFTPFPMNGEFSITVEENAGCNAWNGADDMTFGLCNGYTQSNCRQCLDSSAATTEPDDREPGVLRFVDAAGGRLDGGADRRRAHSDLLSRKDAQRRGRQRTLFVISGGGLVDRRAATIRRHHGGWPLGLLIFLQAQVGRVDPRRRSRGALVQRLVVVTDGQAVEVDLRRRRGR